MKIEENTAVSTINKIYGFIKNIQFIGDEMDILNDVKEIDYQLNKFYYWDAMKTHQNMIDKYYIKLNEMGYFKYKDKTDRSPADKIRHNLRVVKAWLIRIVALDTCDEIAKSVLKDQLKAMVEKYEGAEVAEHIELLGNMIIEFDNMLLDKLQI